MWDIHVQWLWTGHDRNHDPHEPNENNPNPFHINFTHPTCTAYSITHPSTAIWILYLIAIWLHSYHHVAFQVIRAILSAVWLILIAGNVGVAENTISATMLTTVLSWMSIKPSFQILPVCPVCQDVFPINLQTPMSCPKCSQGGSTIPLFKDQLRQRQGGPSKPKKPQMCFLFNSISDQLHDLLDQWRSLPNWWPQDGLYLDIFNGHIVWLVLGSDSQPFFCNTPQDCNGPNDKLRVGLTVLLQP